MLRSFTTIFLFIFFFSSYTFSQVRVDDSKNIYSVVQGLAGQGVKISNIQVHGKSSPYSPYGYFSDANKEIGLSSGLILTSGAARIANGPNNRNDAGQENNDNTYDPDLAVYSNGQSLYDLCSIEFDIETSGNTLSFNYVFGSDEYPEYPDFNDVFGLFISGPGISGKKNLAVVPGTNLPVSVSNIHPYYYRSSSQVFPAVNEQYYISNPGGSNITQYDGFTVVFTASTAVNPCTTYHIKLAIQDLRDDQYDSGVFIQQGSFKSETIPDIQVFYEFPNFPFAIEGCNKAKLLFLRDKNVSNNTDVTYKLDISGTATNGVDYNQIPDSIVIPQGKDSVWLTLDFIKDGIKENTEDAIIGIKSICPNFPDLVSVDVPVHDVFPYSIPSDVICKNGSSILNSRPDHSKNIIWDSSPFLSCTNCLSPTATPDTNRYFKYTITDTASGCQAFDSVLVEILTVTADFDYHTENCYTSLDIFFTNTSINANRYLWDFGDNSTSEDANPQHLYTNNNSRDPITFTIKLMVKSNHPQCISEISKTVTIYNTLYFPNLITPNGDGKNDFLEIIGIGNECWTLELYDRWGGLVYKKENYHKDFNGLGFTEGLYFMQVYNSNKDREYKGWVQIISEKNSR